MLGRYVIKGVLGAGGMGVVYRAHDPELGRTISDIESDALYIKLKWLARGTGRMWIDNVTLDVVPAR